ncbi:MAG: hypothetical protein NW205_07285 [Hyphomicrobiaceae bacterium]|nr:hypothetical protein [Hyphomicrobiaceae bacterium]
MAETGLKCSLERIGLRQADFARLIGVSARTVSLWATGEKALPGPVCAYLRLIRDMPPDALARELRRVAGRAKMLDEGLYSLSYGVPGGAKSDTALAVLRNGKVLGSDRLGGVFSGTYEFDAVEEINRLHVRLKMPPRGTLVTGHVSGSQGEVIDILAAVERAAPLSRATVSVLGSPVEIELSFLGALPV